MPVPPVNKTTSTSSRCRSDSSSGLMILMVTALNEAGDIERAVQAGTDDFLSKPVNKTELLKRVENMKRCILGSAFNTPFARAIGSC